MADEIGESPDLELVNEKMAHNNNNKEAPVGFAQLQFRVDVSELKELVQLKGVDSVQKLNDGLGGIDQLAQKLNTDLQYGLSGSNTDMDSRIRKYGRNEIPPRSMKSIFRLMFEAVQDVTLIMLIVCAVISIALSFYDPGEVVLDEEFHEKHSKSENLEWVEGTAIMIAVVVVVFVTAFNDWRKERQFRGLKDRIEQDNRASVVRNGQIVEISLKELVVGDLCCIKYGDLIPADGIVVQASDLHVDESSLTGESNLIKKNNTDNFILLSGLLLFVIINLLLNLFETAHNNNKNLFLLL